MQHFHEKSVMQGPDLDTRNSCCRKPKGSRAAATEEEERNARRKEWAWRTDNDESVTPTFLFTFIVRQCTCFSFFNIIVLGWVGWAFTIALVQWFFFKKKQLGRGAWRNFARKINKRKFILCFGLRGSVSIFQGEKESPDLDDFFVKVFFFIFVMQHGWRLSHKRFSMV